MFITCTAKFNTITMHFAHILYLRVPFISQNKGRYLTPIQYLAVNLSNVHKLCSL